MTPVKSPARQMRHFAVMVWPYHPELLATPVPRYTSFPTAAEFGEAVGPGDMAAALGGIEAAQPLSLYVHIPYCREICWYCGCNTGAANRAGRLAAYLDRLGDEAELIAAALSGRGRIGRVAFGGGSPNAIAPDQFDTLMARLGGAFDLSQAEFSIELDPRGFDHRWAAAIARHRITRASLGVQTFDPRIQAAIGRVQPTEQVACTVSQLRAAGITSLNFDMMYGLPGQWAQDLSASLETAIALAPDRLAVFGYAHVPHLLPRQRRIDARALPGAQSRFAMAALAHRQLAGAGYQAVGFDHFAHAADPLAAAARAGTLRRNFQGFTDDPADVLIGIGASAISSFPGALLQNEKNAGRWHLRVGAGQFATARGLHRTARDREIAAAIEAILCRGDADLSRLQPLDAVRSRLAPFESRGLIGWRGDRLLLTSGALPYARGIAAALDPYRCQSAARFSSAV